MQENNDSKNHFIEKRKYPRIPLKITFQCLSKVAENTSEDGLLHFHSKDLCCGGVFIEKGLEFQEGTILLMKFKLPEKEKLINVKGLVLRTNDDGAGIRFLTLNIDDFESIDNYINQYLA